MARIVVCGYMIRHPLAGNLLAYLHYVLGLHRLGHEVAYVESSGWSDSCYDPASGQYGSDPGPGLDAVDTVLRQYGLRIPVGYADEPSGEVFGVDRATLTRLLAGADLLLNLGGVSWLEEFRLSRRRALVDMDPLFTQVGAFGGSLIADHDVHFSYGTNIGRPDCPIPTRGVQWHPLLPPVVPEIWERRERPATGPGGAEQTRLTTVSSWDAYGGVSYEGQFYGQKGQEFTKLIDLPAHTSQPLELALSGADPSVWKELRAAGWSVRSAGEVTADLASLQRYIHGSRGEFSAAKNAYVQTRSGWFSDRTVCYLASGKPAVLQSTGLAPERVATGRGVLTFTTVEEAAACIDEVNRDYETHCRAAAALARDTFGYRVVLPRLLEISLDAEVRSG